MELEVMMSHPHTSPARPSRWLILSALVAAGALVLLAYSKIKPRLIIDREGSERVRCAANLRQTGGIEEDPGHTFHHSNRSTEVMMSDPQPTPLDYATPLPRDARKRRRQVTLYAVLGIFIATATVFALLPAPRRSYSIDPRIKCASNLRQIGQAMLLYANENGGKYPDHIEGLLVEEIEPHVFVCPSSNDTDAAIGPTTSATGINLIAPGHCSYIYCGKGFTSASTARTIHAYEPLSHHGDGSNVLFGDGHVEFIQTVMINKLLAELAAGHNPPRPEQLK